MNSAPMLRPRGRRLVRVALLESVPTPQSTKSELPQGRRPLFTLVSNRRRGETRSCPSTRREAGPSPQGKGVAEYRGLAGPDGGASGRRRRCPAQDASGRPAPQDGCDLGATLVHGRQRAAIINGRVYLLGECARRGDAQWAARVPRPDRARHGVPSSKDRPRPIVLAYPGRHSPRKPRTPLHGGAADDDLASLLERAWSRTRPEGGGASVPFLD